jgi:predicted kinase
MLQATRKIPLSPSAPLLDAHRHDACSRRSKSDILLEHGAPQSDTGDRAQFSTLKSSEENHASDDMIFYEPYADIRASLDYTYHKNYTMERQRLQASIVQKFLDDAILIDQNGEVCTIPTRPWIVFTAGAFGAGKGYTLNQLVRKGRFPLMAFVRVNPDDIRRELPEFPLYVRDNPDFAGELTNKEAGYIAEILTLAGLRSGKNVIVDGSLRCASWYREYFARLRVEFPLLRIAIIHVTAPRASVFQRAAVSMLLRFPRYLVERPLMMVCDTHFMMSRNARFTQSESFHVKHLQKPLSRFPAACMSLHRWLIIMWSCGMLLVLRTLSLLPLDRLGRHLHRSGSSTFQALLDPVYRVQIIPVVTPANPLVFACRTCKWVPKCQTQLIEKSKQLEQSLITAGEN